MMTNPNYILNVFTWQTVQSLKEKVDNSNLIPDDLKRLGIDAQVIHELDNARILFQSKEDMNFYKLNGKIKKSSSKGMGEWGKDFYEYWVYVG